MIEALAVTVLPAGFLVILFGGGALFLRNGIGQDGKPPINRALFYAGKYSILLIWGAMALASWGIGFAVIEVPRILRIIALLFWFAGFALLFLGRFTMGDSFRLGTAQEDTSLRTNGLFRLSRNPMYVGVYATAVASALYTTNPIVILLGAFVIAVHHRIVLAEENHMQETFGRHYADYCRCVGRYIWVYAPGS
jgi:protein-S-isoprenylcysteine O-methyltransferase Ste14